MPPHPNNNPHIAHHPGGTMKILNSSSPTSVVDINQKEMELYDNFSALDNKDSDKISTRVTDVAKPTREEETRVSFWNRLLAWISMALAIFAASSIGPAFKYMEVHGISACLAASWRCQAMALFLIPLAIVEVLSNKNNQVDWFSIQPGLKYPVIVHVIISGIAWAGNLLFWIEGLQYTTTFKAALVASSHPILLVMCMQFKGMPVSGLEWLGVFLSFGGMVLSSSKDIISEFNGAQSRSECMFEFLGLFLCLLAAAAEVVLLFNSFITKKVPLMQYTAATTIVVCLIASVASVVLEGSIVMGSSTAQNGVQVFCRQDHCVFGWTSEQWALKVLAFGLWVGVVCCAGFNYAIQYVPPLIFSSLGLVEPALTAILSWLIGVESWPSLLTWLGGFTVMAGVGVITLGEHLREQAQANEAVDPTSTDTTCGDTGEPTASAINGNDHGGNLSLLSTNTKRCNTGGVRYSSLGTQEDDSDSSMGALEGDIELGVPQRFGNRQTAIVMGVDNCDDSKESE